MKTRSGRFWASGRSCPSTSSFAGPTPLSADTGMGLRIAVPKTSKFARFPLIASGYSNMEKDNALSQAIAELVQKGAVEKVNNPNSLGYNSCLFLVPKPGKRWRMVIDLCSFNQSLLVQKFKRETPESIRASLQKGKWTTSLDLTDAYLHVPINAYSRKLVRFQWGRGQSER